MYTSILVAALLSSITTTLATPTPQAATGLCKKSYEANYDDITTGPVAVLDKTPSPYKDLGLQGLFTVPPGLLNTLQPHSPPNVIGFNLVGQVVAGSAPTFTTSYPGSKVKSFTLRSNYLSCTLINPAGIYVPTSCSVTATGTKTDGSKVTQALTYTVPLLSLGPAPAQAQTFGSQFTDLTSVVFSVAAAGVATPVTGVSFDNTVYDLVYDCADCSGCAAA